MTSEAPRRSGGFWFWLVLAGLAVAMLANSLLKPQGNRQNDQALGKSLTRLELEPLSGDAPEIGLAELQGRVTLLNFWGTWCPPCRKELPHVVALRERLRGERRFQLLSVSCGTDEDADLSALRDETAAFLRRQGFDLPAYADPLAATRLAVLEMLDAPEFYYPTTLVLDEAGAVRGVWTGYREGDEREVEALIAKLLSAADERGASAR